MKKTASFLIFSVAATTLLAGFTAACAQESVNAGEFAFSYGPPWKNKPVSSSMRVAELTYDIADEKLADVDLVFFHFPGGGGGTQANLDRWVKQFEGQPVTESSVESFGASKVHFLQVKGTYLDGPPFGGTKTPREGYMMLAAVVESEKGSVFLKMTGPEASIEAAKAAFKTLSVSPFKK